MSKKPRTDPEPVVLAGEDGRLVVPSRDIPTYLRPLIGASWDTEIAVDRRPQLDFFHRPLAQGFQHVAGCKSKLDTNMTMAATLPTPCQLALFGISLKILEAGDEKDRAAIKTGLLEFIFCGNRVYFQRPIDEVPDTMDAKQDWHDLLDRQTGEKPKLAECFKKAAEYFAKMENPPLRTLLDGGYALTILPQECFSVRLSWPNGLTLSNPVKIRTSLWGIHYTPV